MPLVQRQVLLDAGAVVPCVWFVEQGLVSEMAVMDDASAVETSAVGHEGFVGLPLLLQSDCVPLKFVVQVAGEALTLPADAFRAQIGALPVLSRLMHRAAQALYALAAQSSACNRRHDATQRCARWLLLTHDRVGRDELRITQQSLAQMLGVRRATVTEVAGVLEDTGAISYGYGRITVRDRARLEAAACECYGTIRREFDRLISRGN